jgi:hypothetical protein
LPPPEEGRSGREKGGEGLNRLENLVAVMFDMDREWAMPHSYSPYLLARLRLG